MVEWELTVKHAGGEAMDKMVTLLVGRPWDWKSDEGGASMRTWRFKSQQEVMEAERRVLDVSDFKTSVQEFDREALTELLRDYLEWKPTTGK